MALYEPESGIPSLNIKGDLFVFDCPKVMGIVNVTPDSFHSASRAQKEDEILEKAEKMLTEGADIVDVGGYSSRPGANTITIQEELDRVIPAVASIRNHFTEAVISVDTFRSTVAKEAIHAGADIINDIQGGQADDRMFETVASLQVPYIMMHMRGTPQTMKGLTDYEDIAAELFSFFQERIQKLLQQGVTDIILDPGLGFAKVMRQSYYLLSQISYFKSLGFPILIGLSRKSMIYRTLDTEAPNALNGTTAAHIIALMNGADVLRVHDVKEAKEAIQIYLAYNSTLA